MSHILNKAGGVFESFHRRLMNCDIPFDQFTSDALPPEHASLALKVWLQRFQSEFRSILIMNRFVTEIVSAGDPIDVYAAAVEMVGDEIRHAALCMEIVRALGGKPALQSPIPPVLSEKFLQAPMTERALHTALGMLLINETISVGYIEDLARRCTTPIISDVLKATCEDEEEHQDYGATYVKQSLSRFDAQSRSSWQKVVQMALAPHIASADKALAHVLPKDQNLDAFPDQEYISWGLYSGERQALVFRHTFESVLKPKLVALELWQP